jgi:putative FmdB family regulatory protein
MPIYEYECRNCGDKFELLRSISASDREIKCPRCGADNPRRVLSTFSTGGSGGSCSPSSPT